MHRLILTLVCLHGVSAIVLHAQDDGFRVQLVLDVPDDVESVVQSFCARELRSLGDVMIVEDDEDYILYIQVMEVQQGSRTPGYAAAYVILEPIGQEWFDGLDVPDDPWQVTLGLVDALGVRNYRKSSLLTSEHDNDGLRYICEMSVADLDADLLESGRLTREVIELMRAAQDSTSP